MQVQRARRAFTMARRTRTVKRGRRQQTAPVVGVVTVCHSVKPFAVPSSRLVAGSENSKDFAAPSVKVLR